MLKFIFPFILVLSTGSASAHTIEQCDINSSIEGVEGLMEAAENQEFGRLAPIIALGAVIEQDPEGFLVPHLKDFAQVLSAGEHVNPYNWGTRFYQACIEAADQP